MVFHLGGRRLQQFASYSGLPKRLTYHGDPDRMLEWYPDGKSILFATSRTSEKDRFNQLYKISAKGGLPEKLPVPYGEFGAISPDGKTLAYIPITVDFRTWKRYRGGMNSAIWLFDLETYAAKNITGNEAANSQPMWHGSTLYFLSDRDKNRRANIWAYDTKKEKFRQITSFDEFDTHFPNIGPADIIFENGLRPVSDKSRQVFRRDLKLRSYPSEGFDGAQTALFSSGQVSCPDGAKVGTITIDTPLLAQPLEGSVYLANQTANPFSSLLDETATLWPYS